jgi:SAM-dependent methyltransferase
MSANSPWIAPSHPGVYDEIGRRYRSHRSPDPRIAAQIERALGDAATVCNVGAGLGAYESTSRRVLAVEPSREMLRQRGASEARVVRGVAEALPFADQAFASALAVLTVHHWLDPDQGLAELRRIARRRVVFSFDLRRHYHYWLVSDYLPEIATLEDRCPTVEQIAEGIEATRVETIWIPHDCRDGFMCAYWRRPEAYLDPDVRACISAIAQLEPAIVERGISQLAADLASGVWHERHRADLERETMDWGYRLIVSDPED